MSFSWWMDTLGNLWLALLAFFAIGLAMKFAWKSIVAIHKRGWLNVAIGTVAVFIFWAIMYRQFLTIGR